MTLNQKILSVGFLSVLVLILISFGGVAIKDMIDRGNISSGKSPIAEEGATAEPEEDVAITESLPAEETSGEAADAADTTAEKTAPEEESTEGSAGWQTYSNDFYTIDYPASYKTASENKVTGQVNFEINGFGAEAVIFVAGGKKALAFQGTWALISEDQATDQKLLDTENVDMNGIRFTKKYWAVRQVEDGSWLTAIVYYGCNQEGSCFSLLHGMTAKGITAWEEKSGSQLSDKTKIKTIVSIMKASKETDTINFGNMFLTFRFAEKAVGAATVTNTTAAAVAANSTAKATQWKEYIFEPLISSSDTTDRRLVGVRDDGTKDVISASVKTTMGWNGLPGFYPNKVLFPPYAKEIYFTKYLSDSGSSSGMFALDVTTLKYRRLANVGDIYEDYNNYASIISPDKKLIASLGSTDLYILDLAADKATIAATAKEGEILNPAGPGPEYKWLDSNTVQYPVYKAGELNTVAEVRKAVVK